MGMASLAFLGTSLGTAVAGIPGASGQTPPGVQTMSQVQTLFVNPSVGDDKLGNGGERAPLKTITQALHRAGANTIIMLSPGTYSAETGEVFPLILKANVSLQGDQNSKGRGIVITGGGDYLTRTFGSKNVAIVGANQAGLMGVTVTNPNPRGYGLWIEFSSPVITDNTFTGNTQDGIAVTGNSAPTIRNNYFYRNQANGITISGTSRAQVQQNVFQETGFGINIAQSASPTVVGNQIQDNRSGIIVQASSRAVLRNNVIENNKEDGLVAIASAMPDLGNATEPGGNQFRNNARYDINATAAKQVISVYGNSIASSRIAGNVNTNGTTAASNTNQGTSAVVSLSTNSPIAQLSRNSISPNNSVSGQLNPQLLPLQPANSKLSSPPRGQQQPTSKVAGFPTPSSLAASNRQPVPDSPQLNYVRISPTNTIEFVAPQTPANPNAAALQTSPSQGQSLPVLEATPAGDPAISPVANPAVYNPNQSLAAAQPQKGSHYRVMVAVETDRDRKLVQFLAPGAFSTVWQGREAMQAGVFGSRNNADNIVKMLNTNGLRAVVEPTN